MEEPVSTVWLVIQFVLGLLGVMTLIDLVFSGKSSINFYKGYWKRFEANAWLKEKNSGLLTPVKVIARTEDEKFLLVSDWDDDVRLEPIENIILPLEKEIVVKAARISNT